MDMTSISEHPGRRSTARMPLFRKIHEDVDEELKRQLDKWGVQSHDMHKWNSILVEEVGEFAKDLLEDNIKGARTEIIQVAAVALAIAEAMDAGRSGSENGG